MRRAALYVRVSTHEQKMNGLSVDNQIEALKEYCKQNDLLVAGVYNDAGISAHVSYKKRPALLRMIEACQNKEVDIILFTRIDRFFRSIKDYYLVMDQISVPWRAIWEDYNTETSDGQFKVNIMLSISEAEAARTSEKIKSIMEFKRAKGDYVGGTPFGYMRKDRKLMKNPELEKITREMFDVYLATGSTQRVVRFLEQNGFLAAHATISKRLKNPIYCDETWEPYITKEEHERILSTMKNHVRESKNPNRIYIFTGLIFCKDCKKRLKEKVTLYGDSKEKEHYKIICMGRAGSRHVGYTYSVSEKRMERQVLNLIEPAMEAYNDAIIKANSRDVDNTKLIEKLKRKIERVGIRFEDGDISQDEYKKKRNAIMQEIAELEKDQKNYTPLSLPENWRDMYDQLSRLGKREFMRSFIDAIWVDEFNRYSITIDDIVLRKK